MVGQTSGGENRKEAGGAIENIKDCSMYAKEKTKQTILWWELIILMSRL